MMYTWIIDSGHGGMINGEYQTAPDKMHTFPNGDTWFEGLGNRVMKYQLLKELRVRGIHCVDLCPTNLDVPLRTRVNIVNEYDQVYHCILLSLHSNAGGGSGFEVWTSPGETMSDQLATILGERLKMDFPGIAFRQDWSDGDLDKESLFTILTDTNCPAVLPECLFFDNRKDYQLLRSKTFQRDYVMSLVKFVESVERQELDV